jgi:hypothetical protein
LEGMMPVAMGMTRVPKMVMSTSQIIRQISKVIFMVLGREDERIMQMRRVVRWYLCKLTEQRWG